MGGGKEKKKKKVRRQCVSESPTGYNALLWMDHFKQWVLKEDLKPRP